jgi:hypothetical protein
MVYPFEVQNGLLVPQFALRSVILSERRALWPEQPSCVPDVAVDKQIATQAANEESMYLIRNAQILRCAQDDILKSCSDLWDHLACCFGWPQRASPL